MTTPYNNKQLSAHAAMLVLKGMSSTQIIAALKKEPYWVQSQETDLKTQLTKFIPQFKAGIGQSPVRRRVFELETLEDILRGDIAQGLDGLDLSNPRDVKDIVHLYNQMMSNPNRGPHDIRSALDLLDNPEDLVARFKALYPDDPEEDEDALLPDDAAVPADSAAGATEQVISE